MSDWKKVQYKDGKYRTTEDSATDITSDFTFSSPFSYQAGGAYIQGDLLVINIIVHAAASASSSTSVFSIDLHGRTLQTYQYLTLNDRGAMRTIMISPQGAATIDANDSFSKNTDYPLLSGVLVLN